MSTVVVALKDIVPDDGDIDLTSLPETDAIEHIRGQFGFLSSHLQVSIQDGIATIALPPANAERAAFLTSIAGGVGVFSFVPSIFSPVPSGPDISTFACR